MSKVFTATAIMQLVERSQVELAAPVAEYVRLVQKPTASRSITVRDLLWHTSGLRDYLESGMYTDVNHVSPEYIDGQLPAWSRDARPGQAHVYSNTNYLILAKVIEAVSGIGFAEFIHDNLLTPIRLTNTFVLGRQSAAARLARGYMNTGYGLGLFEPSAEFPLETLGDGGVFSSLSDLVRWQSLFWGGELVSEQTLDLMQTPGRLDSGESFEYGLGLQVEHREDGSTWCGHGGSWTSTTTLIGRYAKERTSVIVLSNETMAPVERISQRVIAMGADLHADNAAQQGDAV